MIGLRGLVVRDARRYRAPHHEGLTDPHPEERPLGRVSKDEATELEMLLTASAGGGSSQSGMGLN